MSTRERLDWLEAHIGTSPVIIWVLGAIAVVAVVTAICCAYNAADINDLRADWDEADGENPEGLPGRLKAMERDITGLREQTRAHTNLAAVEFVGNFVGPDDYDTGPVTDEPSTAPLQVQRPTPYARPVAVPGPSTDSKAEAIEKGHEELIAGFEVRKIGDRTFQFRTS